MSADTYSTYEAKARFSELLRKVRSGRSVTITCHAVAELRPIEPAAGPEAHMERLVERGLVTARPDRRGAVEQVARRPGALGRFLEERDEG